MTDIALEPSMADALAEIERSPDLSALKRSHLSCSVRQFGRWALGILGRSLEQIPARLTAVRFVMDRLHYAQVGSNPKTFANHRANVRAAVRWYCKEKDVPVRGTPLRPQWARLREKLTDRRSRAILSELMRFCSAKAIAPEAVTEAVLDALMAYRAATTSRATDAAARRSIARVWNACAGQIDGWPSVQLVEPPPRIREGKPAYAEFPESFRASLESYLESLQQKRRKDANGKRRRPCKPSTISGRRATVLAAARMAVRIGVPIEQLTSLAALVHPDMATRVLDAYWEKDGDNPKVFTIDLSNRFVSIAHWLGTFSEAEIERLEDARAALEDERPEGMTVKNLALIRQVLTPGVWDQVIRLRNALMAEARELRSHARVKAALRAQLAVAIGILSVAPVRLGNLIATELDSNLIRPGGLGSPFWLVFPDYDVKNRVTVNVPFNRSLTDLIDEYIQDYRPFLLRGSNSRALFPGQARASKTAHTLSGQISKCIKKATGLSVTVHQFRHAAAAVYLKHHPGAYEAVRQLLGHRNINTTIRFYCALESMQASVEFAKILEPKLQNKLDLEDEE